MTRLRYLGNCVGWDRKDVIAFGGLLEMVAEGRQITRRTFLRYVDREELNAIEEGLGYSRGGLTMAQDWHVSYHKGRLHEKSAVWFRWSGIEYVFSEEGVRR